MLQPLSGGAKQVSVDGFNLRQILDRLEQLYPGIKARLMEGDRIRPNLSVAIDGEISRMGLLQKVELTSEVHFIPAIGGGSSFP